MKRMRLVSSILFLGVVLSVLLAASFGVTPASAAAFTNCAGIADVPEVECDALVALYDSTNGASWSTNTNWKVSDTVCNWHGITCDIAHEHVEQVYLSSNNLSGPFAGDFTGFSELTQIYISNSSLTGSVTTVLGLLPTTIFGIGFYNNDLTGVIPASISSFINLQNLNLSRNMITGDFATFLGNLPASLIDLNVRLNSMTGTISTEFSGLPNLEAVYIGYNSLVGDFATILSGMPSGMRTFWSESTGFTGTIPASISSFTDLYQLNLNWNQVTGDIGTIIPNLPSGMVYLSLSGNDFYGGIPPQLAGLTSLQVLDLSSNQISGDLSETLGYMPASIVSIFIGYNNFGGTIPASISTLTNLNSLGVNNMPGVSGTIPLSITTLPPFNLLNITETFLCEPDNPAYAAWKANVNYYYDSWCLPSFNGGAEITASGPIVAIGRPHMGTEIMAYSGVNSGALKVYLPMLFKNTWGNYTSSFTVQNLSGGIATFALQFRDALDGSLDCTISGEQLDTHGIKTYDVTALPACDGSGSLPAGWYGGALINSNSAITAVARPKINGVDQVTYNGFTSGADVSYLPMLFRGKWGYQSAFYVQNLDPTQTAQIVVKFYDSDGNFTCLYEPLDLIQPMATMGFWLAGIPEAACQYPGTGGSFPAAGWAGNAVIETTDFSDSDQIVAIGRPHLGDEVAAYNGVSSGSTVNYLPMLFRNKWGYQSAFYVQNLGAVASTISIEFFDTDGNPTCTFDGGTIGQGATSGFWTPAITVCDTGGFPADWAGSAKITTSQNAAVVGRAHLSDGEVVVYNAFTGGGGSIYVPMLFRKNAGNESAIYVQNLDAIPQNITFTFYDEETAEYCTYQQTVAPNVSAAVWLASLDGTACVP